MDAERRMQSYFWHSGWTQVPNLNRIPAWEIDPSHQHTEQQHSPCFQPKSNIILHYLYLNDAFQTLVYWGDWVCGHLMHLTVLSFLI